MSIRTAHTSDLDAATLAAARALLDDVFDGELTDADWEHALGGIHALAYEGDELVGHASVVQRRLLYDGRALRAGYVEGVGVSPRHRRRGHAGRADGRARSGSSARAYDLGALGATDEAVPLYERHGWRAWEGPLSVAHAGRASCRRRTSRARSTSSATDARPDPGADRATGATATSGDYVPARPTEPTRIRIDVPLCCATRIVTPTCGTLTPTFGSAGSQYSRRSSNSGCPACPRM